MTDDELVLLAREGDAGAFDRLVVRHQAAVYRAALAALRVREDAEEAAQDAFVRAWAHLGRFRGEATFRTWMLSIVWRRAMSKRRSRVLWWSRRVPLDEGASVIASAPGPEHVAIGAEMRGRIAGAIEALSPKLRDALLLAQTGEYDYESIAVMLQIPAGTVKSRVSEARRRVREQMVKQGYVSAR